MRPSDEEIRVLQSAATKVGLTVRYMPTEEDWANPWLLKRTRTGFSWRVKDETRVMFHIGNENPRMRALRSIARLNLKGQ